MIKLVNLLNEIRILTDFQAALEQKGYAIGQTEFPKGLNLSGTKIKNIPRVKVIGDLNLSNTQISSLPNGLKVYGNLVLNNTSVVLPQRLKIRGSLYLKGVKIDYKVSDQIQVGYRVYIDNELTMWYLPDDLRRKAKVV